MKKTITELFISPQASIRDAIQVITNAARLKLPVGITLVTDKEDKLIGTVTDGDIRKALVRGIDLNETVEKIMAKDPITVDQGLEVDSMIKTVVRKVKEAGRIRDYKVDKVIVTDTNNRAVDIFNFYELWYKQEIRYKKICIIGAGHVGLTLSVILAEAGYQVVGFDIDKNAVRRLKKGESTFYEEGLQPLLKLHLKEGNLDFVSCLKNEGADVYIVCVGTPVDTKTKKPVFEQVKNAAQDLGRILKKEDMVILRSTVSIGTTRDFVLPILEKESSLKAGVDFYLAFAPERAVEGKALEETKAIPQIIGGINQKSAQEASRIFQTINSSVIILDSLEEAEMVKLLNNNFRDLTFAFANKVALMCNKLRLDTVKIIKAANDAYPRNPIALPSPGVGGYCLTKDPYLMAEAAEKIEMNSDIFLESRKVNTQMPYFVANETLRFIKEYLPIQAKIKIYLMGFAFKGHPETSDMRNSPTIDVLKILQAELGQRADFCGYDPIVEKGNIENLKIKYLNYKDGFNKAHCVLIMNNNLEFAKIDIFSLIEAMHKPGFFLDGWHFFLPQEIKRVKGIFYQGLGGGF